MCCVRETKRGGACCARKTKGEGRHVRETRDGGAMRERREGVVCVCAIRESFRNWFTKNLSINCFRYFYIGFSGQQKSNQFD